MHTIYLSQPFMFQDDTHGVYSNANYWQTFFIGDEYNKSDTRKYVSVFYIIVTFQGLNCLLSLDIRYVMILFVIDIILPVTNTSECS